jgi:uncharacterized DUF497 family protein
MDFSVAGFQWDRGNREKCQKHGVPIATIECLFRRDLAVFPDPAHSAMEVRYKAIGRTENKRAVLIVFTLRGQGGARLIRPISARFMHRKEIAYFDEAIARIAERPGG